MEEEEEVPEEMKELLTSLETSFKDMREVAREKLRSYREVRDWSLAGTKARAAPAMVAKIYRSGRTCEMYVRDFVQSKGLEGNHPANEILLLSMMIDKAIVESPGEWINYKTTEIAFRRLHGIERAFANVFKESDWRAPKGNTKGWKTKVQFRLLDEIDIRALDENGTVIDSVDKEVREQLQSKALLEKALGKLGDAAADAS